MYAKQNKSRPSVILLTKFWFKALFSFENWFNHHHHHYLHSFIHSMNDSNKQTKKKFGKFENFQKTSRHFMQSFSLFLYLYILTITNRFSL